MPILEALMGSPSSDLYDAIFDVEYTCEFDLFEESDDFPALRSLASRDSLRPGLSGPGVRKSPRREVFTPQGSPKPRMPRNLSPSARSANSPIEMLSGGGLKLFEPRSQAEPSDPGIEASLKRLEALVGDVRSLPVQRLKDEMKELQDRQARIENLLLMLTRGMRNEIGHAARHDTLP